MRVFKFGDKVRLRDGSKAAFISYYPALTDERFLSNLHRCIVARCIDHAEFPIGFHMANFLADYYSSHPCDRVSLTGFTNNNHHQIMSVPIGDVFPDDENSEKAEVKTMKKDTMTIFPFDKDCELDERLQSEIRELFRGSTWKGRPIEGIELSIITEADKDQEVSKSHEEKHDDPIPFVQTGPCKFSDSIKDCLNSLCSKYSRKVLIGYSGTSFFKDAGDIVGKPGAVGIENINKILRKNNVGYIVIPRPFKFGDGELYVRPILAEINWDWYPNMPAYKTLEKLRVDQPNLNFKDDWEKTMKPIMEDIGSKFKSRPWLLTSCYKDHDVSFNEAIVPMNIDGVNEFFQQYAIPYRVVAHFDSFIIDRA